MLARLLLTFDVHTICHTLYMSYLTIQNNKLKQNNLQSSIPILIVYHTAALSKEERTKFHQNIRKIYPTVDSKTELKEANEEQRSSTYILIYPKGAKSLVNPNDALAAARFDENRKGGKKKVVVQRWDRSKPDYLHFTVVKSMLSTSEMVDKLAKMTSMLPTRFEFSGSKDKR